MRWFVLILLTSASIAYALTWLNTPPVALSYNAYDLAEWATLHPIAENVMHPMRTALFLRLALVSLVWMLALHIKCNFEVGSRGRWIGYALLLALIVAVFPPLEILNEPQNANYQQQAILLFATIIGVMLIFFGLFARYARWLMSLAGVVAIISSLIGLWTARELLIGFSMPVMFGWGGFLFVFAVGASVAVNALTRPSDLASG